MDISKYVKNKDLTITNDDLDIESLKKDMTKGYVLKSEVKEPDYSGYVSKEEYSKLQNDFSSMETNYNNTIKSLDDTNNKLAKVTLEKEMLNVGFKEENFEEVAKLRHSLYSEEKDNRIALDNIATKFKDTYFKDRGVKYTNAPNEGSIGSNNSNNNTAIKITRNTSLKDLMVKK